MTEDTAAHRTPDTIFELSRSGRRAWSLPEAPEGAPSTDEFLPDRFRRTVPPRLPEVSEPDLVRHFTTLSERNFAIDNAFYPLGSCTMKHNPKLNEEMAALPGFRDLHPDQPVSDVQGALALLWRFERDLCEVTGMDAGTFNPAAGAHGEITALLMWRRYFADRGETDRRTVISPCAPAAGLNVPASIPVTSHRSRSNRHR
ncbi:MAG TPA: aminomethyl-transferring glycine dehydrogenase subunit GcvPB, partial [Actinomycetota bacterium]|nr:aminomethyl-transferring glycine dehydrogenase subunit GcvPB [Actinomycetota bacterium]